MRRIVGASPNSAPLSSSVVGCQSRGIAIPKQLAAYGGTFSRSTGGRSNNITLGNVVLEDVKAIDRKGDTTRRTKMKDDFREMGLERSVRDALEYGLRVKEPSPIQQLAIDVGTSMRSTALRARAPSTMLMEHADAAEGTSIELGFGAKSLTPSGPLRASALKVASEVERFGATGNGAIVNPGITAVVAVAPPGTGKTIACLAPAYSNMVKDRDHYDLPVREFRPRMLVLSATQDLLKQHQHVCSKFDATTGLRSAVITRSKRMKRKINHILTGSVPSNKRRAAREAKKALFEVEDQLGQSTSDELLARKAELQKVIAAGENKAPVDVLVIHPHMVLRLIRARRLYLDDLRYVVVDEADALLSQDHANTTQQLIGKIQKRNLNRHLPPVQTQFYFSSFGVTRKLNHYLQKHFPTATHCYDPKANQAPNTEGIKYKFLMVEKEGDKVEMLEFLLNKKTQNYPTNPQLTDEDDNNIRKVTPLKGATVVVPHIPEDTPRDAQRASTASAREAAKTSQGAEDVLDLDPEMDAEERMTYAEWVRYRKNLKREQHQSLLEGHAKSAHEAITALTNKKTTGAPSIITLPPATGELTVAPEEAKRKQHLKERATVLERSVRSAGLSNEDLAMQERQDEVYRRQPASSFPHKGMSVGTGDVFVQQGTQKSERAVLGGGASTRVGVSGLGAVDRELSTSQDLEERDGVVPHMVDDVAAVRARRNPLQGLKTSISNALSIRSSRKTASAGLVRPSLRWENVLTHAAPFTFHIPQTFIPQHGLRVMIFATKIDSCAAVYFTLRDKGYNVTLLHGSLPPAVRHDMLKRFASGESNIMVCTDIASRGLDIPVDVVINFDMPTSAVPFLARAGRTGRMGRKGACYSLYHKRRQIIIASALRVLVNKGMSLNDISNDGNHNTQPRYGEWANKHKNMLTKAYINIITRHRLPAKKLKAYINHNAMWRPIWHPKGAHLHGGVPTKQQAKIMGNVMEDAVWFRRQQLANRKGGKAKFGGTMNRDWSWKDGAHSGFVAEGGNIE